MVLEEGVATGLLAGDIRSCHDKKKMMQIAASEMADSTSTTSVTTVYIGDGVMDLPSLLATDIGLVIGHSHSLRRVCELEGVTLLPLSDLNSEFKTRIDTWVRDPASPRPLFAASWADLKPWLQAQP